MAPEISVIMSAYNSEKYVSEAIQSILDQSFQNFEFMITDDCSTDSTLQIISKFKDNRIKIIKNTQNTGLTISLNTMIKNAQGTYIARMDADDIAMPNRLQIQYEYLKRNPNVKLVGTNAIVILDTGEEVEQIPVPTNSEAILSEIFIKNVFIHPTLLIEKHSLVSVGAYSEEYKKAQDYHLIFKFLEKDYMVMNIDKGLLKYRIHTDSISQSNTTQQEYFATQAIEYGLRYVLKLKTPTKTIQELRKILYWGRNTASLHNAIIALRLLNKINHRLTKKYFISQKNLYDKNLIKNRFVGGILKKNILKIL